jgi:cell division protein ZapA (FtsZ GTPase activity inhibitor)
MSEPYAQVSVRILDKEYQVACPASERTDLLDSERRRATSCSKAM